MWYVVLILTVLALALVFALSRRVTLPRLRMTKGNHTLKKPRYVDENVLFTVYRPKVIAPDEWCTLLAFAHLSEKRPGAPPDDPSPMEVVKEQARRRYKAKVVEQQITQQQSRLCENSACCLLTRVLPP